MPGGQAGQAVLEEPAGHTPGCSVRTLSPDEGFGEGATKEVCFSGAFSVVMIRGGVRALLTRGETVTTVQWLEPATITKQDAVESVTYPLALQITIQGPADQLSPEEALELAQKL